MIPSVDEINLARTSCSSRAIESFEFAGLMQRIIKELHVFPYRLCDGKDFVLRARFRLQLANLLPGETPPGCHALTAGTLGDGGVPFTPPERVEYRQQALELRRAGPSGRLRSAWGLRLRQCSGRRG